MLIVWPWLVLGSFVVVLSALTTWLVRAYTLRHALLDIPNARSSHTEPTPRGGGLAIASVFSIGLLALALFDRLAITLLMALLGGGWLLVLVGWWEDRYSLPRWLRFSAHILASLWAIFWLDLWDHSLATGLILLSLVWLINLYNFMDGIDGIAASEAICVAGASIVILGWGSEFNVLFGLLAACCAGFLILNWPPAKIFMGDTGSCFLGFTIGVLALAASAHSAIPLACWLLLLGVFVVDASVTLLRRMLAGTRWYEAHRSHAYQQAAHYLGSHGWVSTAVIAINVGWLLPCAYLLALWPQWAIMIVLVALIPLFWLALALAAGEEKR